MVEGKKQMEAEKRLRPQDVSILQDESFVDRSILDAYQVAFMMP
jgi:hypothetical protein